MGRYKSRMKVLDSQFLSLYGILCYSVQNPVDDYLLNSLDFEIHLLKRFESLN
jgi:hypothetical protein